MKGEKDDEINFFIYLFFTLFKQKKNIIMRKNIISGQSLQRRM